jgi:hypothetical protein
MRDPFHREPKATKSSLGFMTDLVDDVTPQLGGDLDCNTHAITSPTDPTDEHGVGDRGFTDGRYLAFDEIIQAASDTLTVAEVKGMQISNYGQGAENNLQGLPTAAKGMSFAAVCGTAQAAHYFRFQAAANDKFYLDGVAGSDNGSVSIAVPVVGATIYFFTFQTGATAWDWYASTIAGNWVAV